ncbi:hypothetical protein SAMN05421788_101829 [Filimonas lacunae]|uniref:Mu-like prophage tail sheath protein gpL n=1 Tax=Filimonas lacunae TaxID=477680 RepID=A0A173MP15_9BACT|nr:DUF2586 family protein [Filimonas lacunae]BAV09393.1 hypothetical protein FLA_5441 [Filimonas lacunae]SIS72329.1 hypothetical protein SAMN05421788_101829 [Filimonas lacunae]
MSYPKVVVTYSNGNLLSDVSAVDGIAGLAGTVNTVALQGAPVEVYNLADAESKGFTEAAEPVMYRHLQEFYGEVGGNQELHVMGVAATQTMASILDDTNAAGAKKLIAAADGKIRLLGVFRTPPSGYNAGEKFLDADVEAAVTKAKTFAQARLSELSPLRVLVEGRVAKEDSADVFTPDTASNGFAGVVLGGSQSNGSASVGLALGRAVKYPAHIKIGKVANGPLSITTAYVGSKPIKEVVNLENLHGKGFISFMKHPQKAGIYFGIDRMASNDDYRLLAYGRILDKAAVVAAATYVEQIESEINVTTEGKVSDADITYLSGLIEQQINSNMGEQISKVQVVISPAQDIVNTSKIFIKLRIIPKGYTSFIEIDLGLTTA